MRRALSLLIFVFLLVPAVQASPKHDRNRDGVIVFHPNDRRVITDYFRNTRNLPPGLAKRGGDLPPGLQKQLRRNGQLPPGLQKRLTPFPDDLNRRLPRLPGIYRRGIIGNDAVIYDRNQNLILDVFDIFSGRYR